MPSPPWDRLDRELVRSALLGHSNFSLEPSGRSAAVAVLLVPKVDGVEVLLIRRSARSGDPWSSHMALPGGFRAETDSDLLATAIRETREEVGADSMHGATLLGCLDDVNPALRDVTVRPFVFVREHAPAIITSQEVEATAWVDLDAIASGATRTTHAMQINNARYDFPGFRVGEHVVWGMTYRVLTDLVERVAQVFSEREERLKSSPTDPAQPPETFVPTGRRH